MRNGLSRSPRVDRPSGGLTAGRWIMCLITPSHLRLGLSCTVFRIMCCFRSDLHNMVFFIRNCKGKGHGLRMSQLKSRSTWVSGYFLVGWDLGGFIVD